MCIFGFLSSLLSTLYPGDPIRFSFLPFPVMGGTKENRSIALSNPQRLWLFESLTLAFCLFLFFLVCRKRIHSAPILHCPGLITPSEHRSPSVKASTDETKPTRILHNFTKMKTTVAVDVLDVSQHELRSQVSRRMGNYNDLSSHGHQERRRQSERRGRMHRVASKWLARATASDTPNVLRRRRRHSTPTPIFEEANTMVQAAEREQSDGQPRKSKFGRRKSLLSRARSLRGVKSLSDLKTIARRKESKVQRGSPLAERGGQAGGTIECAVVRMRSVNSATSAPLYFSGTAE